MSAVNDKKMITVNIGKESVSAAEGTMLSELAEAYFDKKSPFPALLARVDGKLKELHKTVYDDCTLSFLTIEDAIGYKTYQRSASLLFSRAVQDVLGAEVLEKNVLHFASGDGYFYTLEGDVAIREELLKAVEKRMRELVEAKLPFMKRSMSTAKAIELFHKKGMYDKEKLFKYRRASRVNVYDLDGYVDYCYGYMVRHTGYIDRFALYPYADGIVLWLPDPEAPDTLAPFKISEKLFAVQREAEVWAKRQQVSSVGDLNDLISQGKMNSLFLVSEALQEGRIADIAHRITEQKSVKFIMIAGPSSSGKTTFSRRLSVQLMAQGLNPHPISVDNYFKNRVDTPIDENGEYDFECLGAMDVEQFNTDMGKLLAGETVELPYFNFVTGEREYRGDYMTIGEKDVLVIEGIHCLNDAFSKSLPKENKFKIYISALTQLNVDEHNRVPTTDGRLLRRIVRDNRTRGTKAKDTIARWPSVRRGEENNIFPYQEEADVVFNSALLYELSVIKMYAEPLLFQVTKEDKEYDEANRLLKFLDYFLPMPSEEVPHNSILREFIGGSCFDV